MGCGRVLLWPFTDILFSFVFIYLCMVFKIIFIEIYCIIINLVFLLSYVSYMSFQLQWSGQPHPTYWHKLIDFSHNRKVMHHVYVKRQTRICTTWPSFPFNYRLLFIISTRKLAASCNFLSKRIVLSCFYLLIFYFEKFSTWIWRLTFAIYVKLKFPNIK